MILTLDDILLAASRAHTPQFDSMDDEIKKYAMEQMRAALTVAVADLVKAGRSILDYGADPKDGQLDTALEPFEELAPYESTTKTDIGSAIDNHRPNLGKWIHPHSLAAENERLRKALERQGDNMAFVINHATLPEQWMTKFMAELAEDRAALEDRT